MIKIVAVACLLLAFGGNPAGPRVRSVQQKPMPTALRAAATPVVVRYAPPVPEPLRVVRAFDPPSTPYGPGHRGVDLATATGEVVRAAGVATVQFAGSVAGRGVVVLVHPDAITTEYEPVRPSVQVGEPIARGQPIGRIDGTHGSCARDGCLHWGAKRDGEYFDPLTLLSPLGPVRLLPWSPAEDP